MKKIKALIRRMAIYVVTVYANRIYRKAVEAAEKRHEVEKEMIRKALERHHGRRKHAAEDLKISERTLYRKIKEYGLE